MKNTRFKIIALLSALLAAATVFSACAGSGGAQKTEATSAQPVETTEDPFADNLPEKNFEGAKFRIYGGYPAANFWAEEMDGEVMNDALVERNSEISNRFNIELEYENIYKSSGTEQQLATSYISSMILANDPSWDMYLHVQHTGMPGLIAQKMFLDWNTVPYIDMTQPWWYSNIIRDINFGTKVYAMCGAYNIAILSATELIQFNKDLCDDLKLEYPYQLVKDMKWTHDELLKYVAASAADLNGDGQFTDDADRYGFAGWQYEMLPAIFTGYGGQILTKDKDNMPVIAVNDEKTLKLYDKAIELLKTKGVFYHGKTYGLEDTMFKERRLMFNDGFLSSMPTYREMEDDFGFIPYPMLNEAQDEYYCRTSNIACLSYIPVTNSNLERTGIILEALSNLSFKTTVPTYFDIVLTVKASRDTESEEMIPIIRDSGRFVEAAVSYSPSSVLTSGSNTAASYYATNENALKESVAKLVETYS